VASPAAQVRTGGLGGLGGRAGVTVSPAYRTTIAARASRRTSSSSTHADVKDRGG
jgi:hypothetical protein